MNAEKNPERGPAAAALRGAILLSVFAILGAGLVAVTYQWTKDRIADNQQRYLLRSLHEILPETAYDNELYQDTLQIEAPGLGRRDGQVLVYRARKAQQPVAAILNVVAPDGYSGEIEMLIGIYTSGELAGVRVIAHRETPGLGDDIEPARSDWILGFRGKSLAAPPLADWAVKRDGGEFDQFTGATITPRAVVKSVRNTLLYFRDHRDLLFATTAKSPK